MSVSDNLSQESAQAIREIVRDWMNGDYSNRERKVSGVYRVQCYFQIVREDEVSIHVPMKNHYKNHYKQDERDEVIQELMSEIQSILDSMEYEVKVVEKDKNLAIKRT